MFDGDTAYLTTSKGKISSVTLDGDTATANWTFPDKDRKEDENLKLKAIYGAPILDGDRLYLGTFDGGVFALNAETGRPLWPGPDGNKQKVDGNLAGAVVLGGDNLYFGTTNGLLYGWKKSDGSPAPGWEKPKKLGHGIWAAPVVDGDSVFAATTDGGLHAFAGDGSELWSGFKASGAVVELSVISSELLFVPSINHHVYLVRTADGSVAADFTAKDWVWSNAAVVENELFFGDFSGSLFGLDISNASATPLWPPASVDSEHIRAAPAVIGDVIIVADRKPVVTFINKNDGTVLNRVPLQDAGTVRADLVVRDGAAYISSTNGKLFRAEPENLRVVEIQLSGVKK